MTQLLWVGHGVTQTHFVLTCYLLFFSVEKISEATRKYASLKSDLQHYTEHEKKPSTLHLRHRRRSNVAFFKEKENKELNRTRKLHDMKLAFSEFYLSLILLQNYQTLNFTGFRKILKKHDKVRHYHGYFLNLNLNFFF